MLFIACLPVNSFGLPLSLSLVSGEPSEWKVTLSVVIVAPIICGSLPVAIVVSVVVVDWVTPKNLPPLSKFLTRVVFVSVTVIVCVFSFEVTLQPPFAVDPAHALPS